MPALAIEREALWKRVGEASFLADDEKRAATGYEPLPASSLTTLLAKFDPNQPRVPAGNSDGGQWTGGGYAGTAADADEGRGLSDENPDSELVLGADYISVDNDRKRRVHHYVPREIYRDREFTEEARKVFRDGTTGKLISGPYLES